MQGISCRQFIATSIGAQLCGSAGMGAEPADPDIYTDLLVPVCVSASHIAMTSIRREPVWMILGESAGTAAAMAVEEKVPAQEVSCQKLQSKLLSLKQHLSRPV